MQNRDMLDSWKEIAAYLGRSEKTCRRLEKELGLPVHRLEESPKARVYAYKDEVDQWRQQTQHSEEVPLTSDWITVRSGLKKLFIPVLAIGVLAILAIVVWKFIPGKESASPLSYKQSIAILPFADLSPGGDQEYFCDGMTDELINRLTSIKDLRVPGRTSSFSFKGKKLDIREIGEKLNVQTVLEGSIQRAEDKLRVSVQLINVADDSSLWSERYERDVTDVFLIQDEICQAIVGTLKTRLLGTEKIEIVKRATENIDAYNAYLKGVYLWNKRDRKNLERAVDYFKEAIGKDPEYAHAYAGLASAYAALGLGSWLPEVAYPKAQEAALEALELDDDLAEAHTWLAEVLKNYDFDFYRAEVELKKAIQLNPGYAYGHHVYALHLAYLGRHEEAIQEILKARELDPLVERIGANVGLIYFYARKYDQAEEELTKAFELFPDGLSIHGVMGLVYLATERYEEAIESYKYTISKVGEELAGNIPFLAYSCAVAGKKTDSRALLEKMLEHSDLVYVSPVQIAFVYVGLEEYEEAFRWLQRGLDQKDPWLRYLKVNPCFDPLREDPRYDEVLRKVGLID